MVRTEAMDIKDFAKYKIETENKIRAEICNILTEFKETSGMFPSRIEINVIESTGIGSPTPEYLLGRVIMEVKI